MSVAISLRRDFDAPRLRGLAKKTKIASQARRLLALAAIYDGATRTEAAKIGGVGLQIIRDWVRRFNGRGPEGLLDGKSPGQPSKLNDPQRQAIAQMIESGPIPAVHGVVRWRLVDFVIRLGAEPWRLAKIPRKCTAFYDFQPQNHPLDSPKTHHFMAAYGPIAKKVIYVESGGPLNRNYRKIPYARVSRPIWPLDEVTTPGLVAHRIE